MSMRMFSIKKTTYLTNLSFNALIESTKSMKNYCLSVKSENERKYSFTAFCAYKAFQVKMLLQDNGDLQVETKHTKHD